MGDLLRFPNRGTVEAVGSSLRDFGVVGASEDAALHERFGGLASGIRVSLEIVAQNAEGGLNNVDAIRKRLMSSGYPDEAIDDVVAIVQTPIATPFAGRD